MEELIQQMEKVHQHNNAIVDQALASINSLRDSVERFCTSDLVDESNPAFEALAKIFKDTDEYLDLIARVLKAYYK